MDKYDEKAIKEAEKITERWKSEKRRAEIRRVLSSKNFKDLDFPVDEDEIVDKIEDF